MYDDEDDTSVLSYSTQVVLFYDEEPRTCLGRNGLAEMTNQRIFDFLVATFNIMLHLFLFVKPAATYVVVVHNLLCMVVCGRCFQTRFFQRDMRVINCPKWRVRFSDFLSASVQPCGGR